MFIINIFNHIYIYNVFILIILIFLWIYSNKVLHNKIKIKCKYSIKEKMKNIQMKGNNLKKN